MLRWSSRTVKESSTTSTLGVPGCSARPAAAATGLAARAVPRVGAAEEGAGAVEEEHGQQRERERQQQDDLGSRAGLAVHLEAAAERLDVRLDRIEADAAAGER